MAVFVGGRISLWGQSVSQELTFAKYLLTKRNYDESVYVLKNLQRLSMVSEVQKDSIHFFLGNIYYNQQNLKKSVENFDSVSAISHRLKSEAVFFSSFSNAYLKSYAVAQQHLLNYFPVDSAEQQLRNLELAGISLLQRDFTLFDSLSHHFATGNYSIALQQRNLYEHRERIVHQGNKSPFMAAALSAVLPGAGKFYAGNKGQGMYTLIISTVLGLQAWEGYHKDGPSSFRFIAYGTLFTSLYIGQIWGSAFSVKIKRDQFNETINNQILFDMHIPLRTIFH